MLIATPIRIEKGRRVAVVPNFGGITLDVPALTTGEFFALLSYEIYQGYHIHKLVEVPFSEVLVD